MVDWIFLLVILSFAVGGLFKGVTGIGLPIVALPLIAPQLGMPAAIAIITLPSVVTNLSQAWTLREEFTRLSGITWFIGSGIVGVVLGTFLMSLTPEALLSMGLGLVIVVYLILRLLRPDRVLGAEIARRIAPGVGLAAGLVQGMTGIVAPVGITYFSAMRLARPTFLFATSTMFLTFAAIQIVSISIAGFMTWDRLICGIGGALVALATMPLGNRLGTRLPPSVFDRLILIVLALLSARLVLSGISTL